MGVIIIIRIITKTGYAGWLKTVQLGNREWVIIIECINALGGAILPLVIFKAVIY